MYRRCDRVKPLEFISYDEDEYIAAARILSIIDVFFKVYKNTNKDSWVLCIRDRSVHNSINIIEEGPGIYEKYGFKTYQDAIEFANDTYISSMRKFIDSFNFDYSKLVNTTYKSALYSE